MPTDVKNIQQEESNLMIIKEEFADLLGHYNDPISLYSILIGMCQHNVRPYERAEADELLQDTLLELFDWYANIEKKEKGKIENFQAYCIGTFRKKLNEFRRKKSRSIDYIKFAWSLQESLPLIGGFVDFSLKVSQFLNKIKESTGDSIDEGLVLDRLTELIRIGNTYQGLDINIIKDMERWRSKLMRKIRENSRRVESIDSWTNDEDVDKFNPFSNIPDPAPNAEKILLEKQITNQLYDCIYKLPPIHRELIYLTLFFDDMKQKEIAKKFDRADSTVSEKKKETLRLLRECMTKAHEMRGQA